jgi:hypothetical protein
MPRSILFIFLSFGISLTLSAEEGMFMLNDLPMNTLHDAGLQLNAEELYSSDEPSVSDAIVQIGGGSGSFVSRDGLVITNHHVAVSALQILSSEQHNYLNDGYEASSRAEELHVPGYSAYLAISMTNVTEKILSHVTDSMSPKDRQEAIESAIKRLEESRASQSSDIYHYDVSEFYSGLQYYLFEYLEFKDIRLVYAPPKSIGNYGGDIDNWMWPRHTGDFAFFRLYTDPGKAASGYDESNVPFQPDHFLKFSTKGIQDGDFNFIIGYPGSTQRHRTSYSVTHAVQNVYPFNISAYEDVINIINTATEDNEKLRILYSSRLASLNNYHKNYQGMLEGIGNAFLIQRKQAQEEALIRWIEQKKLRDRRYAHVLPEIKSLYASIDSSFHQEYTMKFMEWLVSTYNIATVLGEWSIAKEKPNLERESKYMDRNIPKLKENLKLLQNRFHPEVDAEIMKYFVYELTQLPETLEISPLMEMLGSKNPENMKQRINDFVDSLYASTQITDVEKRMEIFELSRKEMKALNDPMLNFAFAMQDVRQHLDDWDKTTNGKITRLRPEFIEALMAYQSSDFYPDANFTPRLTYGEVRGYSPKDAVIYDYITSIEGIIEKYTGEEPFNAPAELMNQAQEKNLPDKYFDDYLQNVPVNFLHTTDITGGNSGSPVMDANGNFIGIAFDGNWESISADWVFNPLLTRSISVDARYILYILEDIASTNYVYNELTIIN